MTYDSATLREKAGQHLFIPTFTAKQSDFKIAQILQSGSLELRGQPPFTIGPSVDWSANPYNDTNWQFIFQSLRWTEPLRRAGEATSNEAFLQLYSDILESWCKANLVDRPKSHYAWYDMSSGIRVICLAAAIHTLGPSDWLLSALRAHGEKLSDPNFGSQRGNHALHVRIGLLIAGHLLKEPNWIGQAALGIKDLLLASIDEEGVDTEGGMQYQLNNYLWYREAASHLRAVDIPVGTEFDRLKKMPDFIAHATASTGWPVQFGDSDPMELPDLDSPHLEFLKSKGKSGHAPAETYKKFGAGYIFARTHWNIASVRNQLFYSLRFGPATASQPHAHSDGGSITLTYDETELLFESGRYRYDKSPLSRYLKSSAAHNSVISSADPYDVNTPTNLITSNSNKVLDWTIVERRETRGTIWRRGVLHDRARGRLIVLDQVHGELDSRIDQCWQLPVNSIVRFKNRRALIETGSSHSLQMVWYNDNDVDGTVLEGRSPDLVGWRSTSYGEAFPAPTLRIGADSRSMRTVTVLAPSMPTDAKLRLACFGSFVDSHSSEEAGRPFNGVLQLSQGNDRVFVDFDMDRGMASLRK